jgi:hypothetical protein
MDNVLSDMFVVGRSCFIRDLIAQAYDPTTSLAAE